MADTNITGSAASAPAGMYATYSSLLDRIGRHLHGIRSGFSSDQTNNIEDCIEDGLADVYNAHNWSFFRPIKTLSMTAPYTTGTIAISSGTVELTTGTWPSWAADGVLAVSNQYYEVASRTDDDTIVLEDTSVTVAAGTSYSLARPIYDLDASVEAIKGDMWYEQGQDDGYPVIQERALSQVLTWLQNDPYNDRPTKFALWAKDFDATEGSKRQLVVYPTPNAAYVYKAEMILRPTKISAVNQYPVGGEVLGAVITEACLAAAERNFDEQPGPHTQRFQELLAAAIKSDQEKTAPTRLGPDDPRDERRPYTLSRAQRMGITSINGVAQ